MVTIDVGHRQYAPRTEFFDHLRYHHVGFVSEQSTKLDDIARFDYIVEFLAQPLFEFGIDTLGVDLLPHQIAGNRLQGAQQQLEVTQIVFDGRRHSRILNLDRDLSPVLEPRAMYLAERRGSKRLGLKTREELF